MKLVAQAANSILSGNEENLQSVYDFFSFTDKSAQNQLKRFRDTIRFKERAIYHSNDGTLPESWLQWKEEKERELIGAIQVHCCRWTPGPRGTIERRLIVPTGLIPSLIQYAKDRGIDLDIEDARDFDLGRRLLGGASPTSLRVPQKEALDLLPDGSTLDLKGIGLIRIATGVGKTALAQELIRKVGVRAIFLVPSLPILKQTVKRFEAAFGKKEVRAYGGGKKDTGYVTVATYQSVYKGDPEDFKDIQMVIADECHHVAADTFFDVLQNKLRNAPYRFGLTAFEERADNSTMLIESAVGPVVYTYDAPEAIDDGYLARPTYIVYDVHQTRGTWTEYKTRQGKRTAVATKPSVAYEGSDDLVAYRNWVLGNDFLNEFVGTISQAFEADGKSVLILVDEKEHGDRLMKLIPGAGYAVGGSKDNEELLKDFNARKLKVLIGTSTLGEGADTIPVDVMIQLQGGASRSRTLQADGRALRNETDDNGIARKPNALIIDFNFPHSKILSRHSRMREQVHAGLGSVVHTKLP